MKPTAQQWRAILTTAKRLQKEESKIDRKLKDFCEAIAPDMSPIFLEKGMVYGYLEAIKAAYGIEAYENVSYYLYEVPNVSKSQEKCICTDKDGNEYDAGNLSSYIKFLMEV